MTAEISLVDTLKANLRQGGIFIAFIAIVVLFWAFNPDTFLSSGNLTNIVLQYSYILILAIGMLFVIVLAQIDLSVGSVVAVTGALSGVLVIKQGYPWWVGVVAALVMGILIGAFQGFWVAYVGIPGLHRHPGRHAPLPRPDLPGSRQRLALALPQGATTTSPTASSTVSWAVMASTFSL